MKKIYIFLFLLITTLVASQASAHKRLFILLGQSNMSGRAPIEDADMAVCRAPKPIESFFEYPQGYRYAEVGPRIYFC